MGKCSSKALTKCAVAGFTIWLAGLFYHWFAENINFFIRSWDEIGFDGTQIIAGLTFFIPPLLKAVGSIMLAWVACEMVYRISFIYDRDKS